MKKFLINGTEFDLYNKSYTMGILNITPDSFSSFFQSMSSGSKSAVLMPDSYSLWCDSSPA